MYKNTINESVDTINYLVDKTNWGKSATSKTMLQLVYDECRELGSSLSNIDIKNVIEEVSDVNMMLIYFCCKLPKTDIKDIKQLFLESVNEANQIVNLSPSTKELYLLILKNYSQLTNAFENEMNSLSDIRDTVKAVSAPTLSLACLMNSCKLSTIDTVFAAILIKLRRRYSSYLDQETVMTIFDHTEEEIWHIGKQIEKDIPYAYCNNHTCKDYRKLGNGNIQIRAGQLICISCSTIIQKNAILLSGKQSYKRRCIIEEFEKNLISYNKGDKLIVNIYIFNSIENCIDVVLDLICSDLPLIEFLYYFSNKNTISREIIEEFLLKCLANIFLFSSKDIKQRKRAKAMRRCMNSNPMKLIETATALGLNKKDITRMVFLSTDYLADENYREKCWEHINHEVRINLRRNQAILSILYTIREVLASKTNVSNIILYNLRKNLQVSKYKNTIRYFFLDNEYGIENIIWGDSDD